MKTTNPQLRLGPGDQLEGRRGRAAWTSLVPRPVFPLTDPESMISLRVGEGEEWAFVEALEELDESSSEALRKAVAASRFHIEITRVESVELQHELRLWKVDTRQGPRAFPARLDEWPRPLGPGGSDGWLLTDVCGDVYHVPPKDQLDEKSRKVLWSFVG